MQEIKRLFQRSDPSLGNSIDVHVGQSRSADDLMRHTRAVATKFRRLLGRWERVLGERVWRLCPLPPSTLLSEAYPQDRCAHAQRNIVDAANACVLASCNSRSTRAVPAWGEGNSGVVFTADGCVNIDDLRLRGVI